MAASTEKVPLPCRGTHSWVPSPCTMRSRPTRRRAVIWLNSLSQEPQSRSMLCLVRVEVVRGPGVRRMASVVMVMPPAEPPQGRHAPPRGAVNERERGGTYLLLGWFRKNKGLIVIRFQCRTTLRQAWVFLSSTRVASAYNRHTTTEVSTVRLASAAAGPMSPASSRFMMATAARMVSGEYRNTTPDSVAMET